MEVRHRRWRARTVREPVLIRSSRGLLAQDEGPGDHASPAPQRRFRSDVEGLRAVAIALVVSYHMGLGVSGGYVGVDVFFVISGFLITAQLLGELERDRRISFLRFYARRARRILPAASVTILATVLAARLLLSPVAAERTFVDALAAAVYGANFRFAVQGADYFNATLAPSPLLHFWSLGVEEQFYLLWPLVLLTASLVWRGWRARAGARSPQAPQLVLVAGVLGLIAVGSLLLSIAQTVSSPSWAYYSSATRVWELAVGALAALALARTRRLPGWIAAPMTWGGLVAIGSAAVVFGASTPFPGVAALLPVLGACAIVVGGSAEGVGGTSTVLLGRAPLQWVGARSYSWYLWHWPVLVLAPALLGHRATRADLVVAGAIGLALAAISYRLVEQPLRRVQVLVRKPLLGLGGAAAMAGTSVAAVSFALISLPTLTGPGLAVTPALAAGGTLNATQLSADLRAGVATRAVPANLVPSLRAAPDALPLVVRDGCHLQRAETASRPCVFGDRASTTTVVLFGDSHAAAWFPALDVIAAQKGWRLLDYTKAGCPPVSVSVSTYPQCATWREATLSAIARLHPALVVTTWARYLEVPESAAVAGRHSSPAERWAQGVARLFRFLRANSAATLFLSDTPTLSHLAPECVSAHLSDAQACVAPLTAAERLPAVKAEELRLAARAGVARIDPTSWFCTPTRCPVIVGNILLYRDDSHITPEYARFIAPVLAARLTPLIAPQNAAGSASGHR